MTATSNALYFAEFGGPEVLRYGPLPAPAPESGSVLVRTRAIGLNYADIYRRQGNYHLAGAPPYILGYEAAGTVEAVGAGVAHVRVGQRVAFADVPHANAELVLAPATHIIPLPNDISFEQAAALLLQGLTAHYLTTDSYALQPGATAVVHAVAGGVGQLLTQLIKAKGGLVVGITSSEDKRQQALRNGADIVLLSSDPSWPAAIRAASPGQRGADVVYDSVGSTLQQSLAAARTGGTVVFFGMAGGDPTLVDPRQLMDQSKTLTGGDLWSYLTSQAERIRRANELFDMVRAGQLKPEIGATFALSDGAAAHRLLESRRSTGKILLIP